MRNLEDCKAEVFRRSEERIKERKRNRNRMLACCIPLCLLLVAGGIYVRPLFEPVDEIWEMNAEPTGVPGRELGGMEESMLHAWAANCTSVEIINVISDGDSFRKVTDSDAAAELYRVVVKSFSPPTMGGSGSGGKTSADEKESAMITDGSEKDTIMDEQLKKECTWYGKTADYKLVFHTKGGEEFIFCLYGNVLYDAKNDCGVALTDTQLSELKTQMGH